MQSGGLNPEAQQGKMKGYIYICKMRYEGKSYYKIGRTTDLGKRELALRTANPFFRIVAKKESCRHQREEKEIHSALKDQRFELEWYELTDDQYAALIANFNFDDYSDDERAENLRLARIIIKPSPVKKEKNHTVIKPGSSNLYHVFKKSKKDYAGELFYRWYYYFYDQNGKKIQKACRGCRTRSEAENFIRSIPSEVNQKGQLTIVNS
jgi:hypothetical protein